MSRPLEGVANSINFEFTPAKVEAAVKKILADCRAQNFTVREFAHLVGELTFELENSRNRAEINSAFSPDSEKTFAKKLTEFSHSTVRKPF